MVKKEHITPDYVKDLFRMGRILFFINTNDPFSFPDSLDRILHKIGFEGKYISYKEHVDCHRRFYSKDIIQRMLDKHDQDYGIASKFSDSSYIRNKPYEEGTPHSDVVDFHPFEEEIRLQNVKEDKIIIINPILYIIWLECRYFGTSRYYCSAGMDIARELLNEDFQFGIEGYRVRSNILITKELIS